MPLVGVPGIEPEPHPPHGCILPLYYTPNIFKFCRGAENRTRTLCSQSTYTTTILRPAFAKATAGEPV